MDFRHILLACTCILLHTSNALADSDSYNFRDSDAYKALPVEDREKLEQVHRDLAMLWGALDRYSDHHRSQAPDRLEQLVPQYLLELPTDPFATEESAAEQLPPGEVTSKEGWGYRYRVGSGQAWCIRSVGLPDFPNSAGKTNRGLYTCKGFWSVQHIPFAPEIQRVPEGYEQSLIGLPEGGWLAYYLRPGPGPKLLLIPGSFNDYRIYTEMISSLSPDLYIILMDLRGHGGSWPPAEAPSIELFAGDALRVAEVLKLERFFIGGHSIGGMIAIEVARQRPELIAGIISIEGWTHHAVQKEAFGSVQAEKPSAEGDTEAFQEKARRDILRNMHRERVLHRLSDQQRQHFAQAWRRWDGQAVLETTSLPVLEIWGDRGLGPQPRELMRIPDKPNISLEWVEGEGHDLLIYAPGTVAKLISQFIAR